MFPETGVKSMRSILIALLMTIATQVGAGQLKTTVSALLSDAQVKLEQQKFTGRIDGVSLATEYMLSQNWYLTYEHLSGNGNLNGTTRDFNFNQNSFYAYREFSEDNFFFLNWRLNYRIGVGLYQKASKLGAENYNETQFPVLLGVEMTNTSGVKIGFSGLGQLNNFNDNRFNYCYFQVGWFSIEIHFDF